MPVSWKQAPPSPGDETGAFVEFLQSPDVMVPAVALAALAGAVLVKRAFRTRRKRRRLDPVLPYAHAEPD